MMRPLLLQLRRRVSEWAQALIRSASHTSGPSLPLWGVLTMALMVCLVISAAGSILGYRYFWGKWGVSTLSDINWARWSQAVKESPRDADAWVNLGYAHLEKGDLDHAEDAFRRAANLRPHDPAAEYFIGTVLLEKGRYASAAVYFRDLAAAFPGNPLPIYQLATAYVAMGRHVEAIALLDDVINRLDPTLADVYLLRGRAWEGRGEPELAKRDYLWALRLDPTLGEARKALTRLGVPESQLPPDHTSLTVKRMQRKWWQFWLR